jgi:hypothetical protein
MVVRPNPDAKVEVEKYGLRTTSREPAIGAAAISELSA